MNFLPTLIKGTFIKRYKRFMCDIKLENGMVVTAHCANTGSMLGLLTPGATAYLSPITNPKAKLLYKLELLQTETSLVGVNTANANTIVSEALKARLIQELSDYSIVKPEAQYCAGCRFDFLLENIKGERCYLEVKSVTLCRKSGLAHFPDAKTERGRKHLKHLINVAQNKEKNPKQKKAAILYLVQRTDCSSFDSADDIDPEYGALLREARAAGVQVLTYSCKIEPTGISLHKALASSS